MQATPQWVVEAGQRSRWVPLLSFFANTFIDTLYKKGVIGFIEAMGRSDKREDAFG